MSKRHDFISQHRTKKTGLPPGTLSAPESGTDQPAVVTIMNYSADTFEEVEVKDIKTLSSHIHPSKVTWINIDGVHDVRVIEEVGRLFNIHSLTLEDIMNTDQRPKYEDYDDYDVMTLKMLYYDRKVKSEQLTIILLKGVVLTFQELLGKDAFDPIRSRIRTSKGRVRKMGADYLAYALIDSVVDSYFNILDKVGLILDKADEELRINPDQKTLHALYDLKREILLLRRAVGPMRELITNVDRSESPRITEHTYVYFRDVMDHSVRVVETADVFRDMVGGMMDIYHSTLSNRMNEVMKVLTSISTIFIPVTFIAGVYGMNFQFMPELNKKWGYPAVMIIMITVIITLFFYFRRKRWI